jgi:DNA repair protein RecN (Recombination protein N)
MLEEVRITGLGVIDDAVLELSAGFTALTGETGAGKTMVVTALGLLFGGRADPARVRPGAARAAVEGRLLVTPEVAREVEEAGGDLDDNGSSLVLSRSVSAEGRSRAFAGGHSVPVSLLQVLADDLVAVHGQSDQQQLLKPGRQRDALDRFGGPELAAALVDYRRIYHRHRAVRDELDALTRAERERAAEAETCGSAWPRSRRPPRRRARTRPCWPRRRSSRTPTRCTPRPPPRTRRCSAIRPRPRSTRPTW